MLTLFAADILGAWSDQRMEEEGHHVEDRLVTLLHAACFRIFEA